MKENWKKNTALFLTSQAISLFGSSLVSYAITWYITLTTQSGSMMTISIICGFLPTFLLAPFAGVWADRYNRKILIVLSDSLIAAATLVLAVFFLLGVKEIWLLFVLSAVRSVGTGIQSPAIGAFLPQFVPEDKLTKVNAINGSIQSAIMLVSPMISAMLIAWASIVSIFFIDVVTAAIAVTVMLSFLHVQPHAKALVKQTTSYFADMRLGLRYVRHHRYLKYFFLFCAVFFFLAAPVAFLTPLQVTRTFGGDVWRLMAIEIAFSVGMIAGGLLMTVWGGFKNKIYTMILAGFIFGACTLALGIVPVFWIYLAFMAITGFGMPLFNTPSMVMLQQKVEEEYLGRVFGILTMISSSLMPLGMLLFGPLADVMRIEWMLIVTGVLMLVQAFSLFGNKALIEAGKPVEKQTETV